MEDAVCAFPGHGVGSHVFEKGVVQADFRKAAWEVEGFGEEFPKFPDAFPGGFDFILSLFYAHDADGEAGKARRRFFVQHILHEGGSEDGQAQAVGDGEEGGELVLQGMAGPGHGVAPVDEVVDGPFGIPEQIGPGFFMEAVFHGQRRPVDDGAHHAFHESVHCVEAFGPVQVDFQNVGENVCAAVGRLGGGER